MATSFEVRGVAQLEAALRRKAAQAHAASVRAVADEVGRVEGDARHGAPRLTGALVDGIKGSSRGTSGVVRSSARHGGFVEFGTYKDSPQPYMGPAAEASRGRFPGGAARTIGGALRGR